jgi:hypothetical protein
MLYVVNIWPLYTTYCSRAFVFQRERLLALVAGSSVPSVLSLNCQRTFNKSLVISRRGCIHRALNRKVTCYIYDSTNS